MIEHERSFIFTHEGAKNFLSDINASILETLNFEDIYINECLRVRNFFDDSSRDAILTKKTGSKADGYRHEQEQPISQEAAEILRAHANLIVQKRRLVLDCDKAYCITMDFIESPMKLAILEIEAINRNVMPVPITVPRLLFGVDLLECPLSAYPLLKRKIGICGAPSSGKSESAKLMSYIINSKYGGKSFAVAEYATTFIQKYRRAPEFCDQFFVWFGQKQREADASIADIVISDCPTFLSYIYMKHLNKKPVSRETVLYMSKIYKRVLFETLDYDNIIFLQLSNYKENGIRYQTKEEAFDIERRIREFLLDHNVRHEVASYNDIPELVNKLFYVNEYDSKKII